MSEEKGLRPKAREALLAGKLPLRAAKHVWGGPGGGMACPVCEQPVMSNEMAFQLEFEPETDESSSDDNPMHIRCFTAWDAERQAHKMATASVNPAQTEAPRRAE